MNKHITTAVAVYALIQDNKGSILLEHRKNTTFAGWWQVPAGHVDSEELPTQALLRELHEELGITVFKEDVKLVHISARPKHNETGNRFDLYFQVHKWRGDICNHEPDKREALDWFPLHHLPEKTVPHVHHALECIQKNPNTLTYSELGEEFIIEWRNRSELYKP